ncbi:hypothetical protein Cni_G21233 [Canna indica]|uniref:Uncharacterized protein n=1 Tax=Canna indica TaxID=4628 RepID=A0AAQ3QKH9_9LILI|nr:hypothetical protein Cni_G21233 [Canna indica]
MRVEQLVMEAQARSLMAAGDGSVGAPSAASMGMVVSLPQAQGAFGYNFGLF